MRFLAVVVPLFVLAACLSSPSGADHDAEVEPSGDAAVDGAPIDADPCADLDSDGYVPDGCGGAAPDCMEGVAEVHPGAFDIPGNAVDEDCFGGPLGDGGKLVGNAISGDALDTTITNGVLSLSFLDSYGQSIAALSAAGSGTNLLYAGPADEQIVNTHWWPDYFARETVSPGFTGEVVTRAVYRRRVAWSAVPVGQLSGARWMTVHPDGRVHIDHQVTIEPIGSGSYLTSYVSLVPSEFTDVDWSANGDGPQSLSSYDWGTDGDYYQHLAATDVATAYACAYHDTGGLLVGWGWDVDAVPAARGARVTQGMLGGNAANHSFALQLDWRRPIDGAVASTLTYRGNFLLYLGTTGTTPCQPMAVRHAEVTRPAVLVPTMGTVITTSIGDDDGDGYDQGGGFYTLRASSGEIEVTVDTQSATLVAPRSSTFFIEALGDLDPVVFLNQTQLGHGSDYLLERVSGDAWLHLGIPLADGDVLRIDSP